MIRSNSLVSIIIPVYNVEKYIKQCVDSVLEQKNAEYELILVDDGSTDNSGKICDELKEQNATIKVIHKKNGGLSDARNVGLSHAEGNYIVFLDSDDYWSDNVFLDKVQRIIQANAPDLIVFGYTKFYSDGRKVSYIPGKQFNDVDSLTLNNEFRICAWDKVIKKEILDHDHIEFKKGVFSEDMEWCARVFQGAQSCYVMMEAPHMYRQRDGSITKTITETNVRDVYDNYKRCLSIGESIMENRRDAFKAYMSMNLSTFMIALSLIDKNEQRKYYGFVYKNLETLKKSSRRREKLIYISAKMLGITKTELLLRKATYGKSIN